MWVAEVARDCGTTRARAATVFQGSLRTTECALRATANANTPVPDQATSSALRGEGWVFAGTSTMAALASRSAREACGATQEVRTDTATPADAAAGMAGVMQAVAQHGRTHHANTTDGGG